MATELLPCPFCGNKPEWVNLQHPSGIPAIRCEECQFSMQQDRRDKTIFYWNRRVNQDHSIKESK
jgi:Lar family restriction alleviation protein